MARVYVHSEALWYEELSNVTNYYENEIEDRILLHAGTTFFGYFVSKFKQTITDSKGRTASPDLVLVRSDYSAWYVVEVELFIHGKTHPEKQVEIFLDGKYNAAQVSKYLKSKNPTMDEKKMHDLVQSQQPKVFVIVDGPYASWIEDFRNKGAMVCIFEVYKNTKGIELFRLKGDYPYIITKESHLKYFPSNTYKLVDFKFLPHNDGDELDVKFNDYNLKAKVVIDKKKEKYLIIMNSLIPPQKDLVISLDINGHYLLKLN